MNENNPQALNDQLMRNDIHRSFVAHPFFAAVKADALDRDQVGIFLGQWQLWHDFFDGLSRETSLAAAAGDNRDGRSY